MWAVKKFRPYIYGTTYSVYTDHRALKWLNTAKDENSRWARWAITLQNQDMKIIHRAGKVSNDVDPLSRYPVGSPESMDSEDILNLEGIPELFTEKN